MGRAESKLLSKANRSKTITSRRKIECSTACGVLQALARTNGLKQGTSILCFVKDLFASLFEGLKSVHLLLVLLSPGINRIVLGAAGHNECQRIHESCMQNSDDTISKRPCKCGWSCKLTASLGLPAGCAHKIATRMCCAHTSRQGNCPLCSLVDDRQYLNQCL